MLLGVVILYQLLHEAAHVQKARCYISMCKQADTGQRDGQSKGLSPAPSAYIDSTAVQII